MACIQQGLSEQHGAPTPEPRRSCDMSLGGAAAGSMATPVGLGDRGSPSGPSAPETQTGAPSLVLPGGLASTFAGKVPGCGRQVP